MIEKAKITKIGIVKDGTAIGWGFDAEGKNILIVLWRRLFYQVKVILKLIPYKST